MTIRQGQTCEEWPIAIGMRIAGGTNASRTSAQSAIAAKGSASNVICMREDVPGRASRSMVQNPKTAKSSV